MTASEYLNVAKQYASGENSYRSQVGYNYPNDQAINLAVVAIMDAMEVLANAALAIAIAIVDKPE